MHQATTLLSEVENSAKSLEDADSELVYLINRHTSRPVYMCGNSMFLDRMIIRRDSIFE